MHCDAPYVVVRDFDFASVNACANRYSERAQRSDDGLCAVNGACRAVERCEKAGAVINDWKRGLHSRSSVGCRSVTGYLLLEH